MSDRKIVKRGTMIAAVAVMLSVAGIADAHPRLVSASPAPNATVTGPTRLTLNFSERLVGALSGGDLFMSHGGHAMKVNGLRPAPSTDGESLTFVTGRPLARGSYRLDWHAVSVDTHRVRGSISFNVK